MNETMTKVSEARWDAISDAELLAICFPVLYKVSGTGKVLEWYVSIHAVNEGFVITITHGQQGGKMQKDFEAVTEGKNLGQANETTPLQQAVFQAVARWKKQIDRHYRETVEDAKKAAKASCNPMLAHKWTDKAHTLVKAGVESVALQPKLDGMRCLAKKEAGEVALMSRGGKPITAVPHIVEELTRVMEDGEVWDGELYNHEMDFETMMSIARKKKPDPRHTEMEFHVFDVVDDRPYMERTYGILWTDTGRPVRLSPPNVTFTKAVGWTTFAAGEHFENLLHRHLAFQESQGYEGVIIRRLDLPYEHKRSVQLLKLKTFHDEEFEIVGSETGTAGTDKDGLLVNFICKAGDKEFKAPLCGSEQLLREMWERRDTYVGELATCMFQERSKYGVPRFPKCKGIRGREDLS